MLRGNIWPLSRSVTMERREQGQCQRREKDTPETWAAVWLRKYLEAEKLDI